MAGIIAEVRGRGRCPWGSALLPPERLDRLCNLIAYVLLEEVRSVIEPDRRMPWEGLLEALAFSVSERHVPETPDDKSRSVGQLRQAGFDFAEVAARTDELSGSDYRSGAPSPISPGCEVHRKNFGRWPLCEAASEERPRYEVERERQRASDRPAHDPAEHAKTPFRGQRPGERVTNDQAAHQFRPAAAEAEADRPAPVLDHHGHVLQSKTINEALENPTVFSRGEVIARGCVRQTVAGEVERDAPEVAPQRGDDLPIEETPGGITVQEQEGIAGAFIDVVNARPVELQEAVLHWEQLLRYVESWPAASDLHYGILLAPDCLRRPR